MSKHTPEPWKFYGANEWFDANLTDLPECDAQRAAFVIEASTDGGGDWGAFCVVAHHTLDRLDPRMRRVKAEADGLRIVACVNACKGINPEAVPDLLAACKAAMPLVEFESDSRGHCDRIPWARLCGALRAAIALAEGGHA
jgi:hypothetical protein